MSKRIVVFNGPILCGKDTIVDMLLEHIDDAKRVEVKSHLTALTCMIYGVSREWWDENYTRIGKEVPRPELGHRSMREALIHTSEVVIKPNYGKDYFGQHARMEIDSSEEKWFFFSDGGFIEELYPVGDGYEPLLIRIHRDGCEYGSNDSRGYISSLLLPANWSSVDISNEEGRFNKFYSDVCAACIDHFDL